MKKLAFMFIGLLTIVSMSACRIEKVDNSNEPAKSFTLNLSDFQTISNYTNCDVHFTQSNSYKVVLKATQRWYDSHSITVRHGDLVIMHKQEQKQKGITVLNFNSYSDDAEIWISVPSLKAVSTAGSGDFYAESDITGDHLEVSVAGSGDIKLKNVALTKDFSYTLAGSGNLKTGTVMARNASFSISGSGDLKSKLAKVESTSFHVAGRGDGSIVFDHCGHAETSISGSGDIKLSGSLQSLDKRISGSGDIDTSELQLNK